MFHFPRCSNFVDMIGLDDDIPTWGQCQSAETLCPVPAPPVPAAQCSARTPKQFNNAGKQKEKEQFNLTWCIVWKCLNIKMAQLDVGNPANFSRLGGQLWGRSQGTLDTDKTYQKYQISVVDYKLELETNVIRRFGLVSIVSYSCPSLMIISSASQFHVYLPWGQRPFSIVS